MPKNTPPILKNKLTQAVIAVAVIAVAAWLKIDLVNLDAAPAPASDQTTTAPQSTPTSAPKRTANSREHSTPSGSSSQTVVDRPTPNVSGEIERAIRQHKSGVVGTLTAEVIKTLPDDKDGDRHQRFLMRLPKQIDDVRTILVAHNIDLAPRVPLSTGDIVTIHGQYEWNDRGGVIHWTHIDPKGWRESGWIELDGERYE